MSRLQTRRRIGPTRSPAPPSPVAAGPGAFASRRAAPAERADSAAGARGFSIDFNRVRIHGEPRPALAAPLVQRQDAPTPPKTPPPTLSSKLLSGNPTLDKVLAGTTVVKSGSGTHVGKVQQALVNLGYSLPMFGVDSSWGDETKLALSQFQRDAGVPVTGEVDAATLEALDKRGPDTVLTKYPDYAQLFGDGLLDFTVGVGYDEDGDFDAEIDQIVEGLVKDRKFVEKSDAEAEKVYAKAGLAKPSTGGGKYYIKPAALKYNKKDIDVLVRLVTYKDPEAKKAFLEAMQNSDVSLYTGHGRYGSGPDFDDKHKGEGNIWINPNPTVVDSGTAGMYKELKKQKAEQPLPSISFDKKYKIWMFDGCNTKHYIQPIRTVAKVDPKKTDVFGWGSEIAKTTTDTDVLLFIDGLIAQQSAKELIEALNKANGIKKPLTGLQAEGLGDNPDAP